MKEQEKEAVKKAQARRETARNEYLNRLLASQQRLHSFLMEKMQTVLTIEAIERFVLCSEISMGIIQMTALNPAFVETIERHRYLRTSRKGRVSEATVIDYLRKHFFRLLSLNRHSHISRLILSMQEPDF